VKRAAPHDQALLAFTFRNGYRVIILQVIQP
jgi:hypothetical protein